MKTVRVLFSNSDSFTTSINGTDDEIRRYYVGKVFNLGDGAGGDLMATALFVEFIL